MWDAVELALLFALSEKRSRRHRRVEAAEPGTAGADGLGHGSLRQQRHLELTGLDRRSHVWVRREEGADGASEAALAQEHTQPAARLADVVRYDSKVARHAVLGKRCDQRQRRTDKAETSDQDRVAVPDRGDGLLRRDDACCHLRDLTW